MAIPRGGVTCWILKNVTAAEAYLAKVQEGTDIAIERCGLKCYRFSTQLPLRCRYKEMHGRIRVLGIVPRAAQIIFARGVELRANISTLKISGAATDRALDLLSLITKRTDFVPSKIGRMRTSVNITILKIGGSPLTYNAFLKEGACDDLFLKSIDQRYNKESCSKEGVGRKHLPEITRRSAIEP